MENAFSYEKLGLFYLGRELNIDGEKAGSMPMLFKSGNLTTHAAIIGMTGSGKTGLGIGLIEEAIMDDIPSIVIDPKGDMGNLLLTFPDLQPGDFAPWVDPAEAQKKQLSIDACAAEKAELWRKGLQSWNQEPQRIASLREKTRFTIYTPGSSAGIGISVLQSFSPPSPEVLQDGDTLNSLVDSLVSSLLSLANTKADSNKSPEYVLLSSLFLHFWRRGESLDMERLIGNIVNPPFAKIGVFSLDTFYPQTKRMELALALNGVIASPAFSAWTQGEPLDIQKILYDENGKACTAIFSIAHLNESERMFFVTMLLNRFIDWMRRQAGTSSLKALLYMDEIFGYFPPTANPPSKKPMLLLLKQARAYGVGIILATQNPVDLDYRGLSNIGTWFVGRLQTAQDQDRVIDGISGGSSSGPAESTFRKILADLPGRRFLISSAHLDEVVLFETRWVMSYLKGPISLPDIEKLMEERKQEKDSSGSPSETAHPSAASEAGAVLTHPPLLADTIKQRFYLHPVAVEKYLFEPWLAVVGNVRFYNAKRNIDQVETVSQRLYLDQRFTEPDWYSSEENPYSSADLQERPPHGATYYPPPATVTTLRDLRAYTKSFADYLYNNKKLELYKVAGIALESTPGESLADFKVRLVDRLRELKDQETVKLEEKFQVRQQRIEEDLSRALQKLEKEKGDVTAKTTDTLLSFGTALLGAFFGRKTLSVTSMSRASTGIKNIGRLAREKNEVRNAEEAVMQLEKDIEALAGEIQQETALLAEKYHADNFPIETFAIKPRRSDVFDVDLFILWEMVV
ncbi:MAG: DUF87 domain-containing protein [Desulfopila sp.]|jgi:hypothetical protein|nr:DUF87 domain-containing protein [Desulfopila sp.]